MGYDFSERKAVVTGGGNFSVLNLSKTGKKFDFYKLTDGGNKLDILPYIPSTNLHPLLAAGKLRKGAPDYNLDVRVHRNIGASGGSYLCPRQYGKPCPICEEAQAAKNRGEKTELWPGRRLFYNVIDLADVEKGVKIYETNAMDFQAPLEAAQKDADKDTDIQEVAPNAYFADPNNGLTVKVVAAMKPYTLGNGKTGESLRASSLTLMKRKNSVKGYLDEVCEFDKCLTLLSYEELEAIFTGAVDDTQEEQEEPKKPAVENNEESQSKKKLVEDDPAPKKPAVREEDGAPANKCEYGLRWGKDNDTDPKCDKCFEKDSKTWKSCARG